MNVRIVQHDSALETLAGDWDRIAGSHVFCRHGWLSSWWKHFGRGNQLLVLVAERDGQVVGIAPFYRTYSASTGRCIRFLGSNEVCSDYLKILIDESSHSVSEKESLSRTVADAFTKELIRFNLTKEHRWDMIELTGGLEREPANIAFCKSMQAAGFGIHHDAIDSSWRLELPETWDELTSKHGNSFRRSLKAVNNRLLQPKLVHSFKAVDHASLQRGFAVLVDLHQRRRESLGDPGCFSDPRFRRFLNEAATDALQRCELTLLWTEYKNEPMSAAICLCHAGVSHMYQSGINPDLMEHRPGHLQTMIAIKEAISQKISVYDFLRGDEPYKRLWRAKPVKLVSTRIISGRMLPKLRHQAWATRHALGNWVKSIPKNESTG